MKYIELFSGCGGLSLGLESLSNMQLVMANELSPMPAQTFAFNLLGEDLEKSTQPKKVKWLASQYDLDKMDKRLRENPFEYPKLDDDNLVSDISDENDMLGNLVVANIIELNKFLDRNPRVLAGIKDSIGGDLDFISGGPPCQSFSMAGLRRKDCDKNQLPMEYADFVAKFMPKFVVLENVTGILRAFMDKDTGEKYYAWVEVAKAFAEKKYVPLCLHVNAKYVGVPQNRPRFIMLGVREDVYFNIKSSFNSKEAELFESSESFFCCPEKGVGLLNYFEPEKSPSLFKDTFLHNLVTHLSDEDQVSIKEAIDDLKTIGNEDLKGDGEYSKRLSSIFSICGNKTGKIENHIPRKNVGKVPQRFRLYQVLQSLEESNREVVKEVRGILKSTSEHVEVLSSSAWDVLRVHEFWYSEDGADCWKVFSKKEKSSFEEFLFELRTKKQTQKALAPNKPAGAALSIPDDVCHYDREELRTLTVREMARIQSFPDSFMFRSKVTTGGKMRRFEVPQYTQVGNAVPPLLGRALGLTLKELDKKALPEGAGSSVEECLC